MDEATKRALAVATEALRSTQQVGFPITSPLIGSTPLGSGWIVQTYVSTGPTRIPIKLPRTPSGAILVDNNNGSVIFRTLADKNNTSPSVYQCRATGAVSVTMIVI